MSASDARFLGAPIAVEFDVAPALEKKPGCPDRFVLDGTTHAVVELLSEWHDYERRDRMAHNMRPEHLVTARRRGSWGVGRDVYRVRTDTGRIFEIYYDRAPRGRAHRKGSWVAYRELGDGSAQD